MTITSKIDSEVEVDVIFVNTRERSYPCIAGIDL